MAGLPGPPRIPIARSISRFLFTKLSMDAGDDVEEVMAVVGIDDSAESADDIASSSASGSFEDFGCCASDPSSPTAAGELEMVASTSELSKSRSRVEGETGCSHVVDELAGPGFAGGAHVPAASVVTRAASGGTGDGLEEVQDSDCVVVTSGG